MTRDDALARLRLHEPELRAAGLAALYLFGSTARDTARKDSDVDLLFEVGDARDFSLFHLFDIQDRLTSLLQTKVDLIERCSLRPRIRTHAESEFLRVF